MSKRFYDISPISRSYKGIIFRSTLEVRWATFFDLINWEWQYEAKLIKLPTSSYLPDFYFPDFKGYAEVKPDELLPLERKKCIELSELYIDTPVLLLIGPPSIHPVDIIINGGGGFSAIPIPRSEKHYPLFYTDQFDRYSFPSTTNAALKSRNYQF